MSCIRAKNTKPELIVRRFLFTHGFRYRLNVRNLPGTPDIVLPKYKTVIFVNGCFWHGHIGCKCYSIPKTNTEWWLKKIDDTRNRDKKVNIKLKLLGWRVIVIWTCMLKPKKLDQTLYDLINHIT
ncbi:MAG: very short patch repair endonuclease [Bacteroidales bacterium]|jgi:DNA mismatch endonuclease (patch repair protein)|nr:very short patch repair endonuclease [Bacteroidales bacterium]